MDGLRWLLLLFGVLAIAGVYLYSRIERKKPESINASSEDRELPLGTSRLTPSIADEEIASSDEASPDEQKIMTLRIVASGNGALSGEDLVLSLRGIAVVARRL